MSDENLLSTSEDNVFRQRIKNIDELYTGRELAPLAKPLLALTDATEQHRSLNGDRINILILFFLYLLQGIPLGLSSAVPMLLQNRGASYKQQAEFSFVYWPFSMKLLWAPLVDGLYVQAFGRRKTWLIPVQYLIGVFMMYLSTNVDSWFEPQKDVQLVKLTALFFMLNFLAATQDIVVDGWALTMLKRENVGYASTCNSVGQTAGYFFGYVLFVALESPDFCNSYLRTVPEVKGLITLSGFLHFWGWIFMASTTLVAILKREKLTFGDDSNNLRRSPGMVSFSDSTEGSSYDLSVGETYRMLWNVMKLPSVRLLAIILLTSKIGFSASDAISGLKLIESGIPKEKLAMMAVPLVPLQIVLPLFISKYTNAAKPMNVYLKAYPYRLMMNIVAAVFVWFTPSIMGTVPVYYYVLLLLMYCLHQITLYSMFVASMAFFANVSDPSVGGTYMTLLNTLSNLGTSWPSTVALWIVEGLTFKQCSTDSKNTCLTESAIDMCSKGAGVCQTTLDGYYVEVIVCTAFGFLWYLWAEKKIRYLQSLRPSSWRGPDSSR